MIYSHNKYYFKVPCVSLVNVHVRPQMTQIKIIFTQRSFHKIIMNCTCQPQLVNLYKLQIIEIAIVMDRIKNNPLLQT